MTDIRKELGQFFTAAWAAERLFDTHFPDLGSTDLVWEPTCGLGSCLAAIPAHIPCIGTELDADLVKQARENTGRNVIHGDCRTVSLPKGITAAFGNPPFNLSLFQDLMARCSGLLEIGQRAGFIIPAYFLQTSRTVREFSDRWSIYQEIVPRDLFPNLSKPLVFGLFTRDNSRRLFGFRLFDEVAEIRQLSRAHQQLLYSRIKGPRSVWRETVKQVLQDLGGTAPLATIYREMEGKRPTGNTFWKEKIRQVLQKSFVRVSEGVYSIPEFQNN